MNGKEPSRERLLRESSAIVAKKGDRGTACTRTLRYSTENDQAPISLYLQRAKRSLVGEGLVKLRSLTRLALGFMLK